MSSALALAMLPAVRGASTVPSSLRKRRAHPRDDVARFAQAMLRSKVPLALAVAPMSAADARTQQPVLRTTVRAANHPTL